MPPIKPIVGVVFVLAIGIYIYSNFIKSEVTVISGFNLTSERVKIVTEDISIDVEPEQMYKLQIQRKGELRLSIKDELGDNIRENQYLIGEDPSIILELVSNTNSQCIVEADVSNIYYDKGEETAIGEYEVLNDKEPTQTFVKEISQNLNYYVYPGRYSKDQLPDILPTGTTLKGLFFVNCENLEDIEQLNSDILGSIFFESQ